MRTLTLAALLLAGTPILATPAAAADALMADGAFALSSNPSSGAVFVTLMNHGDKTCTVTGGSSPAAGKVELHTHKDENGVMKMMPIEGGLALPAGASHPLARGGDHVMLMELTRPLAVGDHIDVTLTSDCGDLALKGVEVLDPKAAPTPAPMAHDAMSHDATPTTTPAP